MMVPIDFTFELSELKSFVHERFAGDCPRGALNDISIFSIQHKQGLIIVVAGFAFFVFVQIMKAHGCGRGDVTAFGLGQSLSQNDSIVNAVVNGLEFVWMQIGGQYVSNVQGSCHQDISFETRLNGLMQGHHKHFDFWQENIHCGWNLLEVDPPNGLKMFVNDKAARMPGHAIEDSRDCQLREFAT
jgi:hypothetical protein